MRCDSLVVYLTRRYLRFDPAQPFISIAAILAFLGVAIGVMVLIVAMAIMNGFDKDFERKLFTMNYPLTLYPKISNSISEELLTSLEGAFPGLHFSPFLRTQAIAKSGKALDGVVLFGVDFAREKQINEVVAKALEPAELSGKFDIIVGEELQKDLLLATDSRLLVIFTQFEPTGLNLTPTMKRFDVKGFFHSGLSAYDKSYAFTTLEALQTIKKSPSHLYDGIHIYAKDPMREIERLRAFLPKEVGIIGWWQQNGNFFSALQMEKRALFIVLMLIILIASLNIISSLLMSIMNRRREIALLLTLGATEQEIKKSFFLLGAVIGMGGVILGVILAGVSLWILSSFPIISLPADVYGQDTLPLELSLVDFFLILGGSTLIVLLSSYYPALRASRVDPLQVLRNE